MVAPCSQALAWLVRVTVGIGPTRRASTRLQQELESLRHYMAEQLSCFVNSKEEVKDVKPSVKLEAAYAPAAKLDERSKPPGTTIGTGWSDGFKSHQLYGKMDKAPWGAPWGTMGRCLLTRSDKLTEREYDGELMLQSHLLIDT